MYFNSGLKSLLLSVVIAAHPLLSHAKDAVLPTIPVSDESSASLHKVLDDFSRKNHVAFVIEGILANPKMTFSEEPKSSNNKTLDESTKQIALAFDYDIERLGNVFILRKRYSSLDEMPEITTEECLYSIQKINQVLSIYNKDTNWQMSMLSDIFSKSLTPRQLSMMGKNSLSTTDLNDMQKEMIQTAALSSYIGDKPTIGSVTYNWLKLSPADLQYRWGDLQLPSDFHDIEEQMGKKIPVSATSHLFGFSWQNPRGGDPYFTALSGPLDRSGFYRGISVDMASDDYSDPSDPGHLGNSANIVANDDIGIQGLQAILKSLNASGGDMQAYEKDASVGDRRVTAIGFANVKPKVFLDALVQLCQLKGTVQHLPNGHSVTHLGCATISMTPSVMDLPSTASALLPIPLQRAFHINELRDLNDRKVQNASLKSSQNSSQNSVEEPAEETLSQLKVEMKRQYDIHHGPEIVAAKVKRRNELTSIPALMRLLTIARTRVRIEPLLKGPNTGVSFANLQNSDKDFFPLLLMCEYMVNNGPLFTQPSPEVLTHFSDIVLGGGIERDPDGAKKFSVIFYLPNSRGHLSVTSGFMQIPYTNAN